MSAPKRALLAQRQQRGIAASGGGVDGHGLLGGEARYVMRAAGLGAGPRESLAAERLHTDDRADLVAVDVDVADAGPGHDAVDGGVDARMHAKRQAKTGVVDRI